MVLDKGVPFKLTIYPSLYEESLMLSTPLSFTATVPDSGLQHRLDVRVPSGSNIAGILLTHLEFIFFEGTKWDSPKPDNAFFRSGILGFLFAQLLDGQGRPSSHPFPITCCDTATGKGICSMVKLPLQAGQRVRFYLVQRSILGDKTVAKGERIKGVRFTGKLDLLAGDVCVKSTKTWRQLCVLAQSELKFELDGEGKNVPSLKRQQDSFQDGEYEEGKPPKTRQRLEEAPRVTKTAVSDNTDDEPPNLIYAFVSGGDDES